MGNAIIDTRGTHKLADDDTLCPVNDKSSSLSHQREISHEDFMFIDLISLLIMEPYPDFQGCRISRVSFFALIDRIFHIFFAKCKVHKFQT